MKAFLLQVANVVQGKTSDRLKSILPSLPLVPESIEVAWAATLVVLFLETIYGPMSEARSWPLNFRANETAPLFT